MKEKISHLTRTFSDIMKLIQQRTYHKLENKNIYPGQPKLLILIKANEGITQKELSKKNCVKPATITEMLKKLEANNFVYRLPDDKDKRILRVYLTPQGHRFAEYSEIYCQNMMELLFRDFSDEELQTLTSFSDRMRNNLMEGQNDPQLGCKIL
jgi:DNA-binding MarR family transcriptional regulator